MPIDLGGNAGRFFTPEQQEMLFKRGVDGIDISNGIPRRTVDPKVLENLNEMRNVYKMVQDGDLVPKEMIQPEPAQRQIPQYEPPAQQVQQVVEQETDWMEKLGLKPKAEVQPQGIQQPYAQQQVQQNEEPSINWEGVIREKQISLLQESAKSGINGNDVIEWMGSLTPSDYVNLFKGITNGGTPNEHANTQQSDTRSFTPSIAELAGSNVQVRRDPDLFNAFGMRKQEYNY